MIKLKYNYLHPYTLLIIIKRFIGILIIPIISQITWIILSKYRFIKNPVYYNIFIVFCLGVLITLKYVREKISVNSDKVEIKTGILRREVYANYINKINVINVKYSLLSKFFGAYKIKLITPILYKKFKDGIYLSRKMIDRIVKIKFPNQNTKLIKCNSLFLSLALSLFWLNPINILFITIPFLNKINNILDDATKQKIFSTLDIKIYIVALGVSPIIATLIILLLGFMIISTTMNFLNYGKFSLSENSDFFYTQSGIITKYKNYIDKLSINAIVIKQSLSMKIFKFENIYYNINKSEGIKNDNILLLGDRFKKSKTILKSLGYSMEDDCKSTIKSKSIIGFILLPVCCFIIVLYFILVLKINYKSEIIGILLNLVEIYVVWWIIVRILSYKNTSISINDNGDIVVKGYKGMHLISVYTKSEKIKNIKIRQSIFQKYSNYCNVYIYTSHDNDGKFFAKNLKYNDVFKVLKRINTNV